MTQSGHPPRPAGYPALYRRDYLKRYDVCPRVGTDMRRRDFLGVLSGAAATLPHAVNAQQTAMRTIGWVSPRSSDTEREARSLAAFREGLAQTGYVEGINLTIELRFGDGQYDRLPAFAADLVQREVAVLVTTGGSRIAKLAQAATTIIPIVFTTGSDPVEDGLVRGINRPAGTRPEGF